VSTTPMTADPVTATVEVLRRTIDDLRAAYDLLASRQADPVLTLEAFCRQERDRFFGLDWTPWVRVGDEAPKPGWEASLFLGAGFDHPDADRYGAADRWLKVSGRTLAEAAAALVALLPGVTGTEVRP
jgi:hypothetical protein